MNKLLFPGVFVAFVSLWLSSNLGAETNIRLEPPEWQMGELTTGGQYTLDVKLKATGQTTTEIIEVRPSCPCMTPTVLSPKITPSSDGLIRIIYKEDTPPNAPAHYFRKSVYIRTTDPANPVLTFNISGKTPGTGITPEEVIVFRTADAANYTEVKRRLETLKSQSQTAVIKEYVINESTESIRQRLKNQFSVTQSGDVELFINRGAFIGTDNVLKQLEQMSAMPQMYFPPTPPAPPIPPSFVAPPAGTQDANHTTPATLEVLFFYSAGCPDCQRIKETLLPHLRNRFGDRITVIELDIGDVNNYQRLVALQTKHQVTSNSPVSLVVGNRFLSGVTEITGQAETEIERYASGVGRQASGVPPRQDTTQDTQRTTHDADIRNRFLSFKTATIVGAGLLDGINPCAFATIVFFISFLTFAGRTRKEILAVGVFYTIAVFLTYLFLGIGAFKALQALAVYRLIKDFILYITVALVFGIGLLTLNDLRFYLKTGKTSGIVLQLPLAIKQRIHSVIRDNIGGSGLVIGALVIGFLVTLFEAACTGQIYLPTIVFMLNDPLLKANAVWYLMLYNLMFVIPLVAVFVLAYFGMGSSRFAQFAERNIVLSKILMSLFFIGLGVVLLAYVVSTKILLPI